MKVFVAGATGVLGRPLVAQLVAGGHEVTGTTRTPARVASIDAAGARGVLCDALDRDAVFRAVEEAQAEVVVHQLTALPSSFAKLRKGSEPTNRLRREGTRHLVDAAVAAGTRRVIAESIAFLYPPAAPSAPPATEDVPRWDNGAEPYGTMIGALAALEDAVTGTDGIEGVVLRYGTLYGPGTWYDVDGAMTTMVRRRWLPVVGSGAGVTSFLHVDDAARATVAALDHGTPGIYNVVDDDPVTFAEQVPALAELLGAKPPRRVPSWLARLGAGSVGVELMTSQRGASAAKAKRELGWAPVYASWRDGFAVEYASA